MIENRGYTDFSLKSVITSILDLDDLLTFDIVGKKHPQIVHKHDQDCIPIKQCLQNRLWAGPGAEITVRIICGNMYKGLSTIADIQ